MNVHSLHIYPIKGCAGVALQSMKVGPMGPIPDRYWMLIEPDTGARVTQRRFPLLSQIRVDVETETRVIVTNHKNQRARLRIDTTGNNREALLPSAHVDAVDIGDQAANWFSDIVGCPVRLVRKGDRARHSPGGESHGGLSELAFADEYPMLICALESLQWLNRHLKRPVEMSVFRPNIVLEGEEPFHEDSLMFRRMQIGSLRLHGCTLCYRCGVVNVNQRTGEVDGNVLRTLCKHRMIGGKPCFGLNADHLCTGVISVGDALEIQAAH